MGIKLSQAIRLGQLTLPPRLAFVGAGGKTSAVFHLARQLPPPVIVTATTHFALHQLSLADQHYLVADPDDLPPPDNLINEESSAKVLLFTGPEGAESRTTGLDLKSITLLKQWADRHALPLLVEADGARQRSLKAPAAHEPVIPSFATHVVVVAGLTGLGKPLTSEWVHRPERFAALSGLHEGMAITTEALFKVLSNPEGGLKSIPPQAQRIVLLNQTGDPALRPQAEALANALLSSYHTVLVAELQAEEEVFSAHEPCAGIILAAGEASRFQSPKQLLTWEGEPFVRHVAKTALKAGLSPVIMVTGAFHELVQSAVSELPVIITHNDHWQEGQSTSLQAGLHSTLPQTGSVIFLLADQPQTPAELLTAMVKKHAETLAAIVAPYAGGKRANPVLFDRITFPALLALDGDTGGRALFGSESPFTIEPLDWPDENLLLDVDRIEDYEHLKQIFEQRKGK